MAVRFCFSRAQPTPESPLRTLLDDKMRYKQLLYLAQQCPALDGVHKTTENKVPGVFGVEAVAGSLVLTANSPAVPSLGAAFADTAS